MRKRASDKSRCVADLNNERERVKFHYRFYNQIWRFLRYSRSKRFAVMQPRMHSAVASRKWVSWWLLSALYASLSSFLRTCVLSDRMSCERLRKFEGYVTGTRT